MGLVDLEFSMYQHVQQLNFTEHMLTIVTFV